MGRRHPRGQAVDRPFQFRLLGDAHRVDAAGQRAPSVRARRFDYNPETGEIANNSEASQYLKPYFRKGWEI